MDQIISSSGVETGTGETHSLFNQLASGKHEQVIFCADPASGLRAVIAVHDTTLGPALGGVRMWPYRTEDEAVRDVLRLSTGMTYKAAVSGLNFGGGKAVIIGDSATRTNEPLFRAFGRFVDGLGGRYLTAKDVGVNMQIMEWIFSETRHATCIPEALGGSGDPSPVTAHGVHVGMKACARKAYGSDSLNGRRIAIQGAGHVAASLAGKLSSEGANLFICDIDGEKAAEVAKRTGAEVVAPDAIYGIGADIFSPCALGGVINDTTIGKFTCDIIAGGANNVLEDEARHGQMLLDRGIVYAPDYVINAGGIINISGELEGYNRERAVLKTSGIYDTILNILNTSEKEQIPTNAASDKLAEERIRRIGRVKSIYSSSSS
ncbi:MAG: Glu/Leu/Phe/Val dehydrogenase dimerization domain-containing protein [Balneolaceae bacterium]